MYVKVAYDNFIINEDMMMMMMIEGCGLGLGGCGLVNITGRISDKADKFLLNYSN